MIPNLRLLAFGAVVAATLYAGWKLTDLVASGRVVKATETINQEGRDAADAIAEARQRVRACHQSGRLWDRATGQCGAAVPGAGK